MPQRSATTSATERRFGKSLAAALAVHAALAWVHLEPQLALSVPAALDAQDIELIELPLPLPQPAGLLPVGPQERTPGGDVARAQPERSPRGTPRPTREPPATRVAAPRPAVAEPAPEPPTAQHPALEAPSLEELIAEQFDAPATTRLRAARLDPAALVARVGESRQSASTGGALGLPTAGEGGGPGGAGRGQGARIVTEKFAFGGPSGAFKADVCSVPRRTTASIASVDACEHLLTFFTDRINVPPRRFTEGFPGIEDRVEWFAIRYTGAFRVRHTDIYTFRLNSDDGSQLYVDGLLVVDNDGQHEPMSRHGRVQLASGTHQFKLKYFQGPGMMLALQLFVTRQGYPEKLFRPEF